MLITPLQVSGPTRLACVAEERHPVPHPGEHQRLWLWALRRRHVCPHQSSKATHPHTPSKGNWSNAKYNGWHNSFITQMLVISCWGRKVEAWLTCFPISVLSPDRVWCDFMLVCTKSEGEICASWPIDLYFLANSLEIIPTVATLGDQNMKQMKHIFQNVQHLHVVTNSTPNVIHNAPAAVIYSEVENITKSIQV